MGDAILDVRLDLRGELLYRLYGELRDRITSRVLAPSFVQLSETDRTQLLAEAIQHLRGVKLPEEDFFSAGFSAPDSSRFKRFYAELGCHNASAVLQLFADRKTQICEHIERVKSEICNIAISPSDDLAKALCPKIDQLYWPLLFVRPTGETSVYTWPPSARLIEELLRNGGLRYAYQPTVFLGSQIQSIAGLGEIERAAFDIAHNMGKAGHFQDINTTDVTAGVRAFDDRLIADYERTFGTYESATYDWLLGAVSGVQVRLPSTTGDAESTSLLVLCSPVRSFFHCLAQGSANLISSPQIVILDSNNGTRPEEVVRPRRWDDEERQVTVAFADADDRQLASFFQELRNAASKTAAPRTGLLLAQLTAEGLLESRSRVTNIVGKPSLQGRLAVVSSQIHSLIGQALIPIQKEINKFACSEIPILVCGETGTGKELVADAIHRASYRSQGAFVPLHCAALSDGLLESELFGHVKGAFTGATENRKGKFEHASGGTLFLDEVGDMPMSTQIKLLRVLESQELSPVGSNAVIKTNVRIVAATHRDLPAMIQAGTFRQDLYYRLAGYVITLPPLRERTGDIAALATHFIGRQCDWSEAALQRLRSYSWPGNVRELKNIAQRMAVNLGNKVRIDPGDVIGLPESVAETKASGARQSTQRNSGTGGGGVTAWKTKLNAQLTFFNDLTGSARTSPDDLWTAIDKARKDGAIMDSDLFTQEDSVSYLEDRGKSKTINQLRKASKPSSSKHVPNFKVSESKSSSSSQLRYFFQHLRWWCELNGEERG